MNDNNQLEDSKKLVFSDHRFLILILFSVLISFILVLISMKMYNISGTAQLDLSRPGYQEVRDKIINNESDFRNYSGIGPISKDSIAEFKDLLDQQVKKIELVDAFSGDPLNPDLLLTDIKTE